jgi:plastocyanin
VIVPLTIAAALVAAAPAAAPKPRTVKVADNYYTPLKLKVAKDTRITWKWPAEAGDVHDVKLQNGPRGVKRFHSQPASASFSFKRKLTKPGEYKIVCTLHEEMRMTIRVRR